MLLNAHCTDTLLGAWHIGTACHLGVNPADWMAGEEKVSFDLTTLSFKLRGFPQSGNCTGEKELP